MGSKPAAGTKFRGVAKWLNATDSKSVGEIPLQVRVLSPLQNCEKNMQYNAKVNIRTSEYMKDNDRYDDEFVSVEANSEDEASDKIYEYFNNKGSPYCTLYDVCRIEFFTRID